MHAMDDQHDILMDAINELRIAVGRGCGREKASELLDQPIESMRMHFWSEEQLMEQTGFARVGEHRAEHHRMLAEILQAALACNTAKDSNCARCFASCMTDFSNTSIAWTSSMARGRISAA
jgi:hemerythrin-like metal-binding protein